MKLKKIILPLVVLLLLPSCIWKPRTNEGKMKEMYFTSEYVFFSTGYFLCGNNFQIDVFSYVKKKIKEVTKKEIEKENLVRIDRSKNEIIFFIQDNDDVNKLYLVTFNVLNHNTEIKSVINLKTFIKYGYVEEGFKCVDITTKKYESIRYEIIFEITFVADEESKYQDFKIYISYDMEKFSLCNYEDIIIQNNDNEIIENQYYILENESYSSSDYIKIGNEHYNWIIDENVLLTDANYKKIRENIYDNKVMYISYLIDNNQLYIVTFYEYTWFPHIFADSYNETVHLIFKADVSQEKVEYLGYVPLHKSLSYIFKID